MEIIVPMIIAFVVMTLAAFDNLEHINYDELKVGDTIELNGEKFKLLNFSPGGVLEILDESISTAEAKKFYLKLDMKEHKLRLSTNISGKRTVTIKNFKGSLRGEHLDKIKFEN